MNHIYENASFGENWFDYAPLYERFIAEVPNESHIVEVGCWMGKSVAFLAVEAVNSGKTIVIDAVDTWLGSPEHEYILQRHGRDYLYETFTTNIAPLRHVVNPMRMTSLEASVLYQNDSLDVVFIDAAHDYDSVKADIAAWLPKVKSGGYLAGHDYNQCWSGVIAAVNESLDIQEVVCGCWVYKKP